MLPSHLTPKTWPGWLLVILLRLLVLLPWRWNMVIGKGIGSLLWIVMPTNRRKIININLQLCFPELSQQERITLAKKHVQSISIGLVEIALAWWASDNKMKALNHISGIEHLQAAHLQGKGVILLSAHFTSLEIGGRLLALHAPFHVVYRKNKHPLVEHLMHTNRQKHFDKAISNKNIRSMLTSLRDNHAVWYAPDLHPRSKSSVMAPFFKINTASSTATSRLARVTGAVVLPFICLRRIDGTGYDLNISAPLESFPGDDEIQNATRINQFFESWIKKKPEDYLWLHKRFKKTEFGSAYKG